MGKHTKTKNNDKKNKLIVLIVVIILLIILLIGSAYAWLTLTKTGNKRNTIIVGDISMKLDENLSDGINIKNAYPMPDEDRKNQTTVYKFKITNDGDTDNTYEIYLGDEAIEEGKTRMSDSIVKYRLQKENSDDKIGLVSDLETKELTSDNESKEYKKLDSGTLNIGDEVTYTLQVWMDYNAGNEYQGSILNKKLRLEASQIVK